MADETEIPCLSVWQIGWLIHYLGFYVPLKNISLIWRRHHCQWRAAKFRPMLGAHGLWAGRDLYRATRAVTRDLGFSGLIRRTTPFSRLLRHTRGYGESILTRILTENPQYVNWDVKHKIVKLTMRNHNLKGNYKIECRATRTSDKCEGRIRSRGGVSILCWPVTPAVRP
jgi:hypothetical protein